MKGLVFIVPFLLLAPSLPLAQDSGKISFDGYIQARWVYDSRPDKVPRTTFFIHNAAFELKADIGKRMRADLKITESSGNLIIEDAFLRWKPVMEADIRFGRLKMPFSREELKAPTELVTIGRSWINGIMEGMALLGRDTGVNIEISKRAVGLEFILSWGVFNGTGLISYKDIDNPKQYAGRLEISSPKGIMGVGLNGVWRREGDGMAWGIGADFSAKPFGALCLEGEVIGGRGMGSEAFGGYLVGSCPFDKLEPFIKAEFGEGNGRRRISACLGLNYYLSKDLRVQGQLEGIAKGEESYLQISCQAQGRY
jgi:hypothetical protein